MIGTLIDGEYRVEACLGQGGFGVVYRCREVRLNRIVALKMLRPSALHQSDLERIEEEGRSLASLSHPNIVRIYRLGNHAGSPYIVMEYLTGVPLRTFLRSGAPPLTLVLSIMTQVASGLADIHSKGIVHRDLSTNNVMITTDGTAKILDMGCARSVDVASQTGGQGVPIGTIPYMAPEQIGGEPGSALSDVFSFGVMLYEAVSGVHPFAAEHDLTTLYNIAHLEPEPLDAHIIDVQPELPDLIAKLLAKDPKDRIRSMIHVTKSLRRMLSSVDPATVSGPGVIHHIASPSSMFENPYLNRVMIKRYEDFFGRAHEVKRIFARLNSDPPGSISIVGDRKIGKSSLLNHVYNRRSRETYLGSPDRIIMAFLDLQGRRRLELGQLIQALLESARYDICGRIDIPDVSASLDGMEQFVQHLERPGFRFVIIMDEFESITGDAAFGPEFFSFLRYLANHFNVSYVTSSAKELQALCHRKEIADSPFFNIFASLRLGPFSADEAAELIRVPSQSVGRPLEPYAERLMQLAGLLPLFLQIACSHALEFLEENRDRVKVLDFEDVERRFAQEATPHLQYTWEGFTGHERDVVGRVAVRKAVPRSVWDVLEELNRRGLVVLDEKRPRLFSSTFRDLVVRQRRAVSRGSRVRRLLGF